MNLQIGKNTIMVSIVKLPTEAPVSQEKRWMPIPENFLVDLAAEKILIALIAQSQIEYIYEGYLNHYQIDTKNVTLCRDKLHGIFPIPNTRTCSS